MTPADRAQIDSLRRRCEAAEERARVLAADNDVLGAHLERALQQQAQQAARIELLDCAYGKIALDLRTLRGGHVNAKLIGYDYDRELVSIKKDAA